MKTTIQILAVVIAAVAIYTAARLHRYEITIGGGSRYYSVIKLDRWSGRAWKLDNSGTRWNQVYQASESDPASK